MLNSSQTYQLSDYECNHNAQMSTATIFNYLQDSMDRFSREHAIGHDFCQAHNLTFIIKAYDVRIQQLPKWTDKVHLQTALCNVGPSSLFFLQQLYDNEHKNVLLSSTSHVVLMDLLRQYPARVKRCLPADVINISNPTPQPLASLEPLDIVHTTLNQQVYPDHIDFNQHVNNTHYVTFAERGLDPLFLKKAKLKRIQVAYKHSAMMGDKLKVETKIAPGFTDHQISSQDDPQQQFARIRFSWTRKDR